MKFAMTVAIISGLAGLGSSNAPSKMMMSYAKAVL